MHLPNDSKDPFEPLDSRHGPSRDVIIVYLRQLRDGFLDISKELKDHKEKTSSALEVIRISLATVPKICPQADRCEGMGQELDELRLERAERKGARWMGRFWMVFLSGAIGAASALTAMWFSFFPRGKP
jgi:hypothetical protein